MIEKYMKIWKKEYWTTLIVSAVITFLFGALVICLLKPCSKQPSIQELVEVHLYIEDIEEAVINQHNDETATSYLLSKDKAPFEGEIVRFIGTVADVSKWGALYLDDESAKATYTIVKIDKVPKDDLDHIYKGDWVSGWARVRDSYYSAAPTIKLDFIEWSGTQ